MARLRIQKVASDKGLKLNQVYQSINTERAQRGEKFVAIGTMRRYWHSTEDGSLDGKELDQVSWSFLQEVARIIGCSVYELLPEDDSLGNENPALLEAALA